MDYRVQRLKEDLTNAQQRNKKQRIQLSNYKKVHERNLEIIKKYKEVIDKAIYFINNNGAKQYNHHDNYRGKWYSPDELDTILDILKEVK